MRGRHSGQVQVNELAGKLERAALGSHYPLLLRSALSESRSAIVLSPSWGSESVVTGHWGQPNFQVRGRIGSRFGSLGLCLTTLLYERKNVM